MIDEHDPYRNRVQADDGSSVSSTIHTEINSTLPWIVIATAAAFLALGIAIGSIGMTIIGNKQNHDLAWNAQTECMLVKEHVDTLDHIMSAHGIVPPPLKETPRC